jgi:hypothetical protein
MTTASTLVVAIFTWKGTPQELLAIYDRTVGTVPGMSPGRPLSHVCSSDAGGMTIVDVWESAELFDRFAQNPPFQELMQTSGLPEAGVQVLQVHAMGWPT